MKRLAPILLGLLALVAAPIFAWGHHHEWHSCNVHSDYDVQIAADKLIFTTTSTTPTLIEMSRGKLSIDGHEQTLSAADHQRIAEFEARVRALVPEVREIALQAVDIAFNAVDEVAATLSGGDSKRTHDHLVRARDELRSQLDAQFAAGHWNDAAISKTVEKAVQEIVPDLVADVAAIALRAAFSGDENATKELQERVKRMESELESHVEKRAQALEARADALCPMIAELGQIERSLELRLPDQRSLQLIDRR